MQGPKYVCYLFSKSFYGETHAIRCLEALSEAIVRYSLNFMKKMLRESTSQLTPNSRKISARTEDPIITVCTRRWHRRNVRINYFWKDECMMKSLTHFQNRQSRPSPRSGTTPASLSKRLGGVGVNPGEKWVWGSSTASLKKSPSEDKKGTLQRRKKDPLKISLVGFTAIPPEIHFKPPLNLFGSAGAIPDLQSFFQASQWLIQTSYL